MVVSDNFTKWTKAIPPPNIEAKTVAQAPIENVLQWYRSTSLPHSVHTDKVYQFESKLFKNYVNYFRFIKHGQTEPS